MNAENGLAVLQWSALDAAQRRQALRRPAQQVGTEVAEAVASLIGQVRRAGDAALQALT